MKLKEIIEQLKLYQSHHLNSTKRGYKGQEIDYVEPEDREILFTNNIKSIYCGKYKYLMIVDICRSNKDEIIIRCKGR